ncbi:hypothetical protein Tco_0123757 [Tanacetum coccineum]
MLYRLMIDPLICSLLSIRRDEVFVFLLSSSDLIPEFHALIISDHQVSYLHVDCRVKTSLVYLGQMVELFLNVEKETDLQKLFGLKIFENPFPRSSAYGIHPSDIEERTLVLVKALTRLKAGLIIQPCRVLYLFLVRYDSGFREIIWGLSVLSGSGVAESLSFWNGYKTQSTTSLSCVSDSAIQDEERDGVVLEADASDSLVSLTLVIRFREGFSARSSSIRSPPLG